MSEFDRATVLSRYEATYHRCPRCGLVANRDTPWLEQAYENAIHLADSGLLRRARRSSLFTAAVIRLEGIAGGRFLDWAGGYGVLTQMMRDKGFDYFSHDEYAEPIFAGKYRDEGDVRYDLITAFEVFEHLADPRNELAAVAARTDRILFTTELLPEPAPRVGDWWYYLPAVGQHITFHTVESLRLLGQRLGFTLTSNGVNWHLYTRGQPSIGTRALLSPNTTGRGRQVRRLLADAGAVLSRR